jgi:hypothetical protein
MNNDQIFETVITTCSPAGVVHVAPMGVRYVEAPGGARVVVKPFRPSTTLDNLLTTRTAVLNLTTDVRVFAGCVTGRRDWPVLPASRPGEPTAVRLASTLEHVLLRVESVQDDPERVTFSLSVVRAEQHASFRGFNRAQAAVIEGAVLVSRLRMLRPVKVATVMGYLQIAFDKTAGEAEREAWGWLQDAVAAHAARTRAAA